MVSALKWIFGKTLNSVWFGIAMMLLVAAYVAVGSGLPRVREAFEMDELAFFNAWPFKLVMGLLVANLVTVTFIRIPFTPPRYGVWMIHAGIVTLIYGMSYYYSFKEEGLTLITKGAVVTAYYDKWDRSLYTRVDGLNTQDQHVLTSLPRFKAYKPEEGKLKEADLKGYEPVLIFKDSKGQERVSPLAAELGLKDKLVLDVVGYWPYANIRSEWIEGAGDVTGIRFASADLAGNVRGQTWLVGDDAQGAHEDVGPLELEHRNVDEEVGRGFIAAASKVHTLEVNVEGKPGEKLNVEVGKTYEVAGYKLEVTEFIPAFPAMNGEVVRLLTLMVTPPDGGEKFRRQLIPGREAVTDWKLGVAGAGPMGKRQTEPLDKRLVTRYAFNDSMGVMPGHGERKQLFVTTPSKTYLIETSVSGPTAVTEFQGKKMEMAAGGGGSNTKFMFERVDTLKKFQSVVEVAPEKRNRQEAEAGIFQVIAVKVTCGGWSDLVYVPFQQWALMSPWNGGLVKVPGLNRVLQLQLGQRVRPIGPDFKTGNPTAVRLDEFKLRSYAGGDATSMMQRDFISQITITEGNGKTRVGEAKMNSPVYFGKSPGLGLGDSYWTLFQASWDPNGQKFTVLGVGNRPGLWIVTAGAMLMVVGLMYAFYLKPFIVRRMKANAIEKAKKVGKKVPVGV